MQCIEERILACEEGLNRVENQIIKANLKLILELAEKMTDPTDKIYIEKIISTFCEIVKMQKDIIDEANHSAMLAAGDAPAMAQIPCPAPLLQDLTLWAETQEHSCFAPEGGFQTDEQIRRAFFNYLTYHTVKETRDGRQKPFSKHTVYDYCSKIKKLWEIFYTEWASDRVDANISFNAEGVAEGKTFLNAYRFADVLQHYTDMQWGRMKSGESKTDDVSLFSPKVLGNTVAALAKFMEFNELTARQ